MFSQTKQEWFNAAWKRATEGPQEASRDAFLQCRYRMPGGAPCFIGAGIPDDQFVPEMEGKSAYSLVGLKLIDVSDATGHIRAPGIFLDHLQGIHDVYPAVRWIEMLTEFASEHVLEIPA